MKPSKVIQYLNGIISRRVIDHLKEHGHNASLRKLRRESGARGHRYSLWDHHSNVLPIFSEDMFMQKVNYIHQNPSRAGFAERAEDYLWSSVRIWKRRPLEKEPLMVDIERINWRRLGGGFAARCAERLGLSTRDNNLLLAAARLSIAAAREKLRGANPESRRLSAHQAAKPHSVPVHNP